MPTVAPQRAAPAAARALGLIVLVLGVLGMHALAGGTHMPALEDPSVTAAHVPMPGMSMPASAAAPVDAVAAVDAASGTAVLAGSRPTIDVAAGRAAKHDAMLMCLAVLVGVLTLLAPLGLLLVSTSPSTGACRRPRTRPLSRAPPRALLAQLCVLRT
jgi:hypothetical protein